MRRERKQPEPEQEAGAPEWMVTYCDCMTLMLTFFVLLFSFSSFDESTFEHLFTSFTKTLSTVDQPAKKDGSAFLPTKQILPTVYFNEGSEKVILAREDETGEDETGEDEIREDEAREAGVREAGARAGNNLIEDTESADFRKQKVFLISSDKIFWSKGTIISFNGRKVLSDMASFLRQMPNRIVISENGYTDEKSSKDLGLQRAWAVIKYLTTKQGLDKGRFSLAADTLQRDHKNDQQDHSQAKTERTLEIILLERSIYN